MITANEVYKMKPEIVSHELGNLKGFYYDHIPEIVDSLWGIETDRIEIKTLKDFDFDGRRCWTLRTVWFDESPVMILQNAGREGDDHRERFITNLTLYKEMVAHIKSLLPTEDQSSDVVIDAEEGREDLINFYGNGLFGVFEKY